jgi:hypothetical protein
MLGLAQIESHNYTQAAKTLTKVLTPPPSRAPTNKTQLHLVFLLCLAWMGVTH